MSENKGLKIHVDYMSFTFPLVYSSDIITSFEEYKQDLCDLFYMSYDQYGDIVEYCQNGYIYQISLGEHIRIRFGGTSTAMKMILNPETNEKSEEKYESCQVELKGQACREIECNSFETINYLDIFRYFLYERQGKCTRLDLAIDDFEGDIVSLTYLEKKVSKGEYISCFRTNTKPPKITKGLSLNEENIGWTLYFGKSDGQHKSNKELCIYNKLAERKHHKDDLGISYYARYEMRFRNEYADEVVFYILNNEIDNVGKFAKTQLLNMLRLKKQSKNGKYTTDLQKYRWDDDERWLKFLDLIYSSPLSQRGVMEPTLEIKQQWNSKNVTKQEIMFEIADAYDSQDEYLDIAYAMLVSKIEDKIKWFDEHKFTVKDLQVINNYRKRKFNKFKAEYPGEYIRPYYDLTIEDVNEYVKNLEERKKYFNEMVLPF